MTVSKIYKRQAKLLSEEKEISRLEKIYNGPHKYHESRMEAGERLKRYVEAHNKKVRKLLKDIDEFNSTNG